MISGKIAVVAPVALVIGFGAGFVARPIISPIERQAVLERPTPALSLPARGSQYFATHLDEARRIDVGCGNGSVRGDECRNAREAIVAADARARQRKFLGG